MIDSNLNAVQSLPERPNNIPLIFLCHFDRVFVWKFFKLKDVLKPLEIVEIVIDSQINNLLLQVRKFDAIYT